MTHTKSFTAFMHKLIDYAGLFPPAKLDMEPAIRNYLRYIQGADQWMISRFICPATRLVELSEVAGDQLSNAPKTLHFSILGQGGETAEQFMDGLDADLQAIQEFEDRHQPHVVADVLEVKLPQQLTAALHDMLTHVADKLEEEHPMTPFYEPILGEDWQAVIEATVSGLATQHTRVVKPGKHLEVYRAGFKLRCGGVNAAMFPPVEWVAHAIYACLQHNIPMKFTAGLHHPVRHFNPGVQTMMHGFLNVFGAGLLGAVHNLSQTKIMDILRDEHPEHFTFTNAVFEWNDLLIELDDIIQLRRENFISYGSCSFDEPREDLRNLGMM